MKLDWETIPKGLKNRPRNKAGIPVPWFVGLIDGEYDFRCIRPSGLKIALNDRLCWVCGEKMKRKEVPAFVIGPMGAINRNTAEPPSHLDCAIWSAKNCPFLANPSRKRNEHNLSESAHLPAGEMITRNPGVNLVWASNSWSPYRASQGLLFDIGKPVLTMWFARGREATRDEILESINSGLPILREFAEKDGPEAIKHLEQMTIKALALVPRA